MILHPLAAYLYKKDKRVRTLTLSSMLLCICIKRPGGKLPGFSYTQEVENYGKQTIRFIWSS